jgi:DNA uptake protein ComE-like DNA-binding protein
MKCPACFLATLASIFLTLCQLPIAAAPQSGWRSFPGTRLADSDFADGDSFPVVIVRDGKEETIIARLYFVDCPETLAVSESDRKRVLEQMRYFGQPSPAEVLAAGSAAKQFTAAALSKPFTLWTTFAAAPGRSKATRVYSLITTAEGLDLGEALVSEGLARPHGTGRALPDGRSAADQEQRLKDLESAAILARKGIWKTADPAKLASMREQQREESRQLRAIFSPPAAQESAPESEGGQVPAVDKPKPLNLNTATASQLEKLPGIGKARAASIIEHRPYQSVDDLRYHAKIPLAVFEKIRPFVTVESAEAP